MTFPAASTIFLDPAEYGLSSVPLTISFGQEQLPAISASVAAA